MTAALAGAAHPREAQRACARPSPLLMPITTPLFTSLSSTSSSSGAVDASTIAALPLPVVPPTLSLGPSQSSVSGVANEVSSTTSGAKLAQLLVNDCVTNVAAVCEGTASSAHERRTLESLHPYYFRCDYVGEIAFEGAKALRILFDPRCELVRGAARLELFGDKQCTSRLASYPATPGDGGGGGAAFPAMVVHGDRFYYKFSTTHRDGAETGWGYRAYVTPMRGLQWLNERQVISEPSLEWACWLLNFLLVDASQLSASVQRALHHRAVFDALLGFVRTPQVPQKESVLRVLTQLLLEPSAFDDKQVPDISPLLRVADTVAERFVDVDAHDASVEVSARDSELVDLVVAAVTSDAAFSTRSRTAGTGVNAGSASAASSATATSSAQEVSTEEQDTLRVVNSRFDTSQFTTVVPPVRANAVWRDVPAAQKLACMHSAARALAGAPTLSALRAAYGSEDIDFARPTAWLASHLPTHSSAAQPVPAAAPRMSDAVLADVWGGVCCSSVVVTLTNTQL
ncbi:hypothetical protein EON68_02045, partial [archaeon]